MILFESLVLLLFCFILVMKYLNTSDINETSSMKKESDVELLKTEAEISYISPPKIIYD